MIDPLATQDLRQFARAALADRLLGDELVRLALVANDKGARAERVAAFRSFLQEWRGLRNGSAAPPFSDRALSQALPAPPPDARLMLVLVDVMGFTLGEAGAVLDHDLSECARLLAAGRQWAQGPFEGSALIIEDEPLIAAELRVVVEALGVRVVGSARNADQAIKMAHTHRPDVLIADYNLDGLATGLDAVQAIQQRVPSPVVFITGYPERVLAGDDVEPDFVLTKPYTARAVNAAIAFCLSSDRSGLVIEQ